ncbi:MAG TPA: cell division protein ZapA [Candidatus Polarisedimenticolia bacterium]|jgi:cell division protein ZapA|nr:cell division protein ZapA [Candidatus Polarisedimenticolia bacterium]
MATATKQPPTKDPANGSVRVEIFDQIYNLRGSDGDYILKLAEYVDMKMRAVSEQTATVDSVRLAVLAALNIADEYHLLKRRLATTPPEVRQRTSKLESALDEVLQDGRRTG